MEGHSNCSALPMPIKSFLLLLLESRYLINRFKFDEVFLLPFFFISTWIWLWLVKILISCLLYFTNCDRSFPDKDYLAIIEFGFRRIWRILQIKEGVVHRGRGPRWITPSEIYRILHILQGYRMVFASICEHLWAYEPCVSFCKHEQRSIFSCEQKLQMTGSKHFVNFPPAGISLWLTWRQAQS